MEREGKNDGGLVSREEEKEGEEVGEEKSKAGDEMRQRLQAGIKTCDCACECCVHGHRCVLRRMHF